MIASLLLPVLVAIPGAHVPSADVPGVFGPGPDRSHTAVDPHVSYVCEFDRALGVVTFVNHDPVRPLYTDTSASPGMIGSSPPMLTPPRGTGRYTVFFDAQASLTIDINGVKLTLTAPEHLCNGRPPAPATFSSSPPTGTTSAPPSTPTAVATHPATTGTAPAEDPASAAAEVGAVAGAAIADGAISAVLDQAPTTVFPSSHGDMFGRNSFRRWSGLRLWCGLGRYMS